MWVLLSRADRDRRADRSGVVYSSTGLIEYVNIYLTTGLPGKSKSETAFEPHGVSPNFLWVNHARCAEQPERSGAGHGACP